MPVGTKYASDVIKQVVDLLEKSDEDLILFRSTDVNASGTWHYGSNGPVAYKQGALGVLVVLGYIQDLRHGHPRKSSSHSFMATREQLQRLKAEIQKANQ